MKTTPKPLQWKTSESLVEYPDAVAFMEQRASDIYSGKAPEMVWFLEHPPLYTAGTSAKAKDLLEGYFPVHKTGRGGEYTYHGPGQRVGYIMLDLKTRGQDVRGYVKRLEEWLILTLAEFDLEGDRKDGRIGVWITHPDGVEEKIAALGVRVRKWITFHGISLNVNPDLTHYEGIVPCGISEHGVTSLHSLGIQVSLEEVDKVLKKTFREVFKP